MGARDDLVLALGDVCRAWPALLPPNRMRVSEGIAKNLIIQRPGGAGGPYNPLETAYMVEPADMLASRRHSGLVFVGPAQTGKTVTLVDGWLTHCVINDPGDMLITQMTQDKAREFSKQRLDRAIKNSPNLKAMRSVMARDDNLHDKQFRNGMWVKVGWPTATNFSSTSYRYTAGTDYDRWPDDIDGEGDGWTMMDKRTTTFLSRGMSMVESSPGRPITDPMWEAATPHEAPPVGGILGIYNTSDRRRWYWACPDCEGRFEAKPGMSLFKLPDNDTLMEDVREIDIDKFARQYARVPCPCCGSIIKPAQREGMNHRGIWLPDGADIEAVLAGEAPRTSSIAGYWLGGVAATYVSWEMLIRKHMQALLDYTLTGNELTLQTTTNTDQGMPYMSRRLAEAARKVGGGRVVEHDLERYIVPEWARFAVAAVDVQGGKNAKFVVQVHAIGEHQRQQLVDRYNITESKRPGIGDEFAPIDPAMYPEDWDVLTEKVLLATYRTTDADRELRVKVTGVDTGGEGRKNTTGVPKEQVENVTNNAYAWARRVRKAGHSQKLRLLKGYGSSSVKPDWHVRETKVGGKQGQGDLTLYLLEPNKFKDMVSAGLQRRVVGPNYYHFPEPRSERNPDGWLSQAFFDELAAEVRNENGVWEQIKKRNESFDLCYYIRALCMMLGVDKREFWSSPPSWARPLAENSDVITPEVRRELKAAAVKPAPTAPRERRMARSSYMG